jgi:hypothetical protein
MPSTLSLDVYVSEWPETFAELAPFVCGIKRWEALEANFTVLTMNLDERKSPDLCNRRKILRLHQTHRALS